MIFGALGFVFFAIISFFELWVRKCGFLFYATIVATPNLDRRGAKIANP